MTHALMNLGPTAARSLQTILEITDHVSHGRLRDEAARTVKGLFDLLAWSDGRLDPEEIDLFDAMCQAVPEFKELCQPVETFHPTDPTFGEIPPLLTAVVAHDQHTGERLAPVLVASLETLGYSIIAASGTPIDIEKAELHTYVNGMRALARMLKGGPSVVH